MKVFKINYDDYCVHYFHEGNEVEFNVYPTVVDSGGNIYYMDDDYLPIDSSKDALIKMKGSIRARGYYDCRLYFTDDEYEDIELRELNEIYTYIKPECLKLLKSYDK